MRKPTVVILMTACLANPMPCYRAEWPVVGGEGSWRGSEARKPNGSLIASSIPRV